MATTPPMGAGGMSAPAQMQPEAETEDAGKTEICLVVGQDGALSVYTEQGGQAGPEQPAPDIGQALKMVLDAYKKIGQGGQDQQASFDAGFGGQGQMQQMQQKGPM